MECEVLVHGSRETKPFPQFHKLEQDSEGREIKRPVPETDHPYRCQRTAKRFRVYGSSYCCFAVLCGPHADMARREGFTLDVVREGDA